MVKVSIQVLEEGRGRAKVILHEDVSGSDAPIVLDVGATAILSVRRDTQRIVIMEATEQDVELHGTRSEAVVT